MTELTIVPIAPAGLLFPESLLSTPVFGIFTAFVAINTVVYVVLATSKILPKFHPGDVIHRRDRRVENRSIFPDGVPHRPYGPQRFWFEDNRSDEELAADLDEDLESSRRAK